MRLWDLTTGKLRQILKGYLDWVTSVAFSPDSRLLASGSGGPLLGNNNIVRLWDLTTEAPQETSNDPHVSRLGGSTEAIAFSPMAAC